MRNRDEGEGVEFKLFHAESPSFNLWHLQLVLRWKPGDAKLAETLESRCQLFRWAKDLILYCWEHANTSDQSHSPMNSRIFSFPERFASLIYSGTLFSPSTCQLLRWSFSPPPQCLVSCISSGCPQCLSSCYPSGVLAKQFVITTCSHLFSFHFLLVPSCQVVFDWK